MASPKVALFSTVKVEMEVVDKVTPPEEVMELTNKSPSASIKAFTLPFTAKPKRLVSAEAEAGLT